jgi:hypothetical protein
MLERGVRLGPRGTVANSDKWCAYAESIIEVSFPNAIETQA